MKSVLFASLFGAICQAASVTITTTSGLLQGVEENGVMWFKGIRYAESAETRRWEPPVPFISSKTQNTTAFGPSCIQQFPFDAPSLRSLLNRPPPPESEDCLFLNVWAPSSAAGPKKPVVFWIHGGGLSFGTASLPFYDGLSLASNQNIVVVTINYRTNVFGFPSSPDLPVGGNNLGFMDQDLALQWVQSNIDKFGGDPKKVSIMGQSAGSMSVGAAIARHSDIPPFRAGIMLSGAVTNYPATPSFTNFNMFASAVNCTQTPGAERLQCLKNVPASLISNYTNGPIGGGFTNAPTGGNFVPLVDNVTFYENSLERIGAKQVARVPLLIGSTQDDGSLFTVGRTNLTQFLDQNFPTAKLSSDSVRALYPGLNDTQTLSTLFRDQVFLCPAGRWSRAMAESGLSVFRYSYGAVFADLQIFPGAGAWHTSELNGVFGNYNHTTASGPEAILFNTFQTTIANFVKDPNTSPAPNWPTYYPSNATATLAKLAYVRNVATNDGNVDMNDFVDAVQSTFMDAPCEALWNRLPFWDRAPN